MFATCIFQGALQNLDICYQKQLLGLTCWLLPSATESPPTLIGCFHLLPKVGQLARLALELFTGFFGCHKVPSKEEQLFLWACAVTRRHAAIVTCMKCFGS